MRDERRGLFDYKSVRGTGREQPAFYIHHYRSEYVSMVPEAG